MTAPSDSFDAGAEPTSPHPLGITVADLRACDAFWEAAGVRRDDILRASLVTIARSLRAPRYTVRHVGPEELAAMRTTANRLVVR